jgi:hypothetical protein
MKIFVLLAFSLLGKFVCIAQSDSTTVTHVPTKNTVAVVKEKATVQLYPNPVKNKAELNITGFEPGMVQVQIVNLNGGVERNDQRLLLSGNENIVLMFSLRQGVYFVVLRQKDKLVKKKMVVQ